MAVPERRPRLDAYGRPVPELAEAQKRVTVEETTNVRERSMLHALIEESCRAVMRHGWYGRVHIRFRVIDGIIQPDIYSSLDRNWKNQPEP